MTDEPTSDGTDPVDAAIAWHLRLPSATRDEWQEFVAWLEASPDHAAAYDRVALDDALIAPSLEVAGPDAARPVAAPPAAANDAVPGRFGTRWSARRVAGWAVPALAAVLAVAVVLPRGGASGYEVRTAPGARKLVTFADGSRIALNGASRLRLMPGNPRFAALEQGEATFEIRHDAARPFVVRSGALTLHDLGTVFNVVRDGRRLALKVSAGAVLFEPAGRALTVRPGQGLNVDEARRQVAYARVEPADVGAWRQGRLVFGGERLADAAGALARATGLTIAVAPELADTPFTGSLRLGDDGAAAVERLARLSGHRAVRDGDGWTILSSGHAPD